MAALRSHACPRRGGGAPITRLRGGPPVLQEVAVGEVDEDGGTQGRGRRRGGLGGAKEKFRSCDPTP